MRPEAPPQYYDQVFSLPGRYEKGRHFYYAWAVETVKKKLPNPGPGLDVGCGPGGFLTLALDAGLATDGLDFSEEAVKQATIRANGRGEVFHGGFFEFPRWRQYRWFAILETLEHVQDDLGLLRLLPPTTFAVCSVPSTGDPSHVRRFTNMDEVVRRYGNLFSDFETKQLNKTLFGFYGRLKGTP